MDLRKFTYPARGSERWKRLYKERTAVERVNDYLKTIFSVKQCPSKNRKKSETSFQSGDVYL